MNHVMLVITAPISTTNMTGLRICTRGSSLVKLSSSARTTMSRRNSEIARRSEVARVDMALLAPCEAVEGEVDLQHVYAGLAHEPEGVAVGVLRNKLVDLCQREVADGGDPVRLDVGIGDRDVRVDARGGALHGVRRDLRDRQRRVIRLLELHEDV